MKKLLLSFVMICCLVTYGQSQTLVNGGFELWSNGKPVGWTTDLHGYITSIINIPVSVEFGQQSSIVHSGNSAVMLHSSDFSIPGMDYTLNLPGILQLGESEGFSIPLSDIMNIINAIQDTTGGSDFDPEDLAALSTLSKLLSNGVPCSHVPRSIGMWIKYDADEDDEMMIIAMAKKDGQYVDYASESFEATDGYEKVGLEFDFYGEECDSIQLIIMSSYTLNSGSILYVDDVTLSDQPLGLAQNDVFDVLVCPNPVSNTLYVKMDGNYQWTIVDLMGRTMQYGDGSGAQYINVSSFASGVYLLNLKTNDGKVVTRKISVF